MIQRNSCGMWTISIGTETFPIPFTITAQIKHKDGAQGTTHMAPGCTSADIDDLIYALKRARRAMRRPRRARPG